MDNHSKAALARRLRRCTIVRWKISPPREGSTGRGSSPVSVQSTRPSAQAASAVRPRARGSAKWCTALSIYITVLDEIDSPCDVSATWTDAGTGPTTDVILPSPLADRAKCTAVRATSWRWRGAKRTCSEPRRNRLVSSVIAAAPTSRAGEVRSLRRSPRAPARPSSRSPTGCELGGLDARPQQRCVCPFRAGRVALYVEREAAAHRLSSKRRQMAPHALGQPKRLR